MGIADVAPNMVFSINSIACDPLPSRGAAGINTKDEVTSSVRCAQRVAAERRTKKCVSADAGEMIICLFII